MHIQSGSDIHFIGGSRSWEDLFYNRRQLHRCIILDFCLVINGRWGDSSVGRWDVDGIPGEVLRKSPSSPKAIHDPWAKCRIPACSGIWIPPNKLLLRSRGAAQLGCHTSRWDQREALWGKTGTHRLRGGLKGRTDGGSVCDPVWMLGMKNNSVHIGNHLYFENQKRWGTIPDDLSGVFYSRGTSVPNKNPDDCQTWFFFLLFCNILHILLEIWK